MMQLWSLYWASYIIQVIGPIFLSTLQALHIFFRPGIFATKNLHSTLESHFNWGPSQSKMMFSFLDVVFDSMLLDYSTTESGSPQLCLHISAKLGVVERRWFKYFVVVLAFLHPVGTQSPRP